MDEFKYPIGKLNIDIDLTEEMIANCVAQIEALPDILQKAVEDLTDHQLDAVYRPGGWTLRQVVHHIADANMNGYIRFKLALTEENPVIKPFDETKWADLVDGKTLPVDISITLIKVLHERWTALLKSLSTTDFKREFIHPEMGKLSLERALLIHSWHGNHHVGHIMHWRKRHL